MSQEPPKHMDHQTAKRLSEALQRAQAQLKDFRALPPGSLERSEKWGELGEIAAEINSFFKPAV